MCSMNIVCDKTEYLIPLCCSQICHSRTGEINPVKVSNLVKLYVQRYKYFRKHGRRMDEEERDDREPGTLHSSAWYNIFKKCSLTPLSAQHLCWLFLSNNFCFHSPTCLLCDFMKSSHWSHCKYRKFIIYTMFRNCVLTCTPVWSNTVQFTNPAINDTSETVLLFVDCLLQALQW